MTHLQICAAKAAILALALAAAPATAQDDERVVNRSPSMRDVAATPIQDLNLARDEIPEALKDAVIAPYASEKLVDCAAIRAEVMRLDRVLGDDLDINTGQRRDLTLGKVAKSAVASFIPFRGIIREVTGAADHQRDFQEAILAGAIRRGFLKGLGEARSCPYPARPAFTRVQIGKSDEVSMDMPPPEMEDGPETEDRPETTEEGIPIVSKPVIQGE